MQKIKTWFKKINWKKVNWNLIIIITILVLSIATHFAFYSKPNSTVFDEVYFSRYVSFYLNHKFYFDIHPPLGKLLISGVAKIVDFDPSLKSTRIMQPYSGNGYIWLRLLPMLAGILLPLVVYFIARKLKLSLLASFLAGTLILLENSLLTQSRFILLDSMLILFGFLGLLIYLIAKEKRSLILLSLSALILSFSLCIKWTGLGFLGLALIMEVYFFLRDRKEIKLGWKGLLSNFAILIIIPVAVYFCSYAIHFTIVNQSSEYDGTMSESFQRTLKGSKYENDTNIKPLGLWGKFVETQQVILKANRSFETVKDHPQNSKWFSWPAMGRPVNFWGENRPNDRYARISLWGNPPIYWFSIFAIVILLIDIISAPKKMKEKPWVIIFVMGGFLINFIPFIFIKRYMFIYHYQAALVFAIIALSLLIDRINSPKIKKAVVFGLIAICLATFLFFAPLAYGIEMSMHAQRMRLWLPSWK